MISSPLLSVRTTAIVKCAVSCTARLPSVSLHLLCACHFFVGNCSEEKYRNETDELLTSCFRLCDLHIPTCFWDLLSFFSFSFDDCAWNRCDHNWSMHHLGISTGWRNPLWGKRRRLLCTSSQVSRYAHLQEHLRWSPLLIT